MLDGKKYHGMIEVEGGRGRFQGQLKALRYAHSKEFARGVTPIPHVDIFCIILSCKEDRASLSKFRHQQAASCSRFTTNKLLP